jgi:hypothetical protein
MKPALLMPAALLAVAALFTASCSEGPPPVVNAPPPPVATPPSQVALSDSLVAQAAA